MADGVGVLNRCRLVGLQFLKVKLLDKVRYISVLVTVSVSDLDLDLDLWVRSGGS